MYTHTFPGRIKAHCLTFILDACAIILQFRIMGGNARHDINSGLKTVAWTELPGEEGGEETVAK